VWGDFREISERFQGGFREISEIVQGVVRVG